MYDVKTLHFFRVGGSYFTFSSVCFGVFVLGLGGAILVGVFWALSRLSTKESGAQFGKGSA
jgi:hypothetical protein